MRKLLVALALGLPLMVLADPPQPARFEKSFAILRKALGYASHARVMEELRKNARGPLFSIEGLARIYEERYPDPMTSLRAQSKAFEDTLGKYIDLGEHVEYVKDLDIPANTLALLEKKFADMRKKRSADERAESDEPTFYEFLLEEGWIDSEKPRLAKWEKKIAGVEWDSAKKDRRYLLEQLFRAVQELRKEEWNMTELQDGMHDFRRRLRWLAIYAQSLADLIVLDNPEVHERYTKGQKLEAVAKSPYGSLPDVEKLEFPILFPHVAYLHLNKAIQELGEAKNAAEAMYEWLPAALLEAGDARNITEAKKLAAAIVKKKYKANPKEVAARIYGMLQQNNHSFTEKSDRGILVLVKERLKEQRDWSPKDCREDLEGQ